METANVMKIAPVQSVDTMVVTAKCVWVHLLLSFVIEQELQQSKNFAGTDENMIGVAVGVPPDVAVKNLRQLQAELAQRLYTHVSIAEDNEGFMVYEWSVDGGQGNRIFTIDEQLVAR
ncbi:unnamed protein product [Cylicostephanus goldi]|uniref:Uncharacterized protein n=1 Tax=Cylicostephanus goldi TaxID=71465 RepID=A0A3P7N2Z7_CYLGO|nr:unnamed protein product [Cylicostephanus goldi]